MIKLTEYRKQFKSNYALAKALGKTQKSVDRWLEDDAYIDLEEGRIYKSGPKVNV